MHFIYTAECPGVVTASQFIDGLCKLSFPLLKVKSHPIPGLPITTAYDSPLPINHKKIADINKIMQYIPEEKKGFYDSIGHWPTTTVEHFDD